MSDETPRPGVCDSLIQDIQVRLQQLQAEMDRLRDEKLELELELADCKEMLEEQAKREVNAGPGISIRHAAHSLRTSFDCLRVLTQPGSPYADRPSFELT